MSLNRREMLRWGAVGRGGNAVSSAASSSALPSIVYRRRRCRASRRLRRRRRCADRARRDRSGIVPARQGRARFAAPDRARATSSASSISRKPSSEPRFHVVDLMNGTVESHPRRPWPRLGSRPFGLRRALLERFRFVRDFERHLYHRRLLRRQIRPFDEGPRPRLEQQQRRSRARSSSTTPGMPSPT